MRTLIAFTIFASFLAGCGCSGFTGGGDKVYQRDTESLILCENGGFVANLTTGKLEGFYQQTSAESGIATTGDNGAQAFNLQDASDGTVLTPELGDTAWQSVSLNQTELDHADVQCTDLESRSWWH